MTLTAKQTLETKQMSNKPLRENGEYVVGVDVGTLSARAGVFTLRGEMKASAARPIQVFYPRPQHAEHSSRDIWSAVGEAVQAALESSQIEPSRVVGISFDATCSLVALDAADNPVTVSIDGDPEHNVIVWMDHRAEKQADEINRTHHRVLDYVGGKLSPEQQPPKLKWIKENLPDTWRGAAKFFDLADYLVYEACKEDMRSLCTVVCKWTYMGHEEAHGSWDKGFFKAIDLEDLFAGERAGQRVRGMGTRAGGLKREAAQQLGLPEGTPVGVGIIDAHAGGLGSLGMRTSTESGEKGRGSEKGKGSEEKGKRSEEKADAFDIEQTLCLIGGTSSCHMAISREARFIPGLWGPYFGAMIPDMWLTEGGQSATGALIEHVIENHAYAAQLRRDAEAAGATVYELLNRRVAELRSENQDSFLTLDLHVLPDFHGNRSPRADPQARGMISGLTLDSSFDNLALLYYATIQAIAYGTRHIIEALEAKGYRITRIHACGGAAKNPLWLQEHADITERSIYVAKDCETVLLGAGMLAAVAAGKYDSIVEAMQMMSPIAEVVEPDPATQHFHVGKYEVFKAMSEHQQLYRRMMSEALKTTSEAVGTMSETSDVQITASA